MFFYIKDYTMHKVLWLGCLAVTLLFACDDNDVTGAGPPVEAVITLPELRGLDVSGKIKVVLTQGDPQSITVRGQQNLIDILSERVVDGVWQVGFTEDVRRMEDFTVFATLTDIDQVSLSGATSLRTDGDIATERLDLMASGVAEIEVSGSVDRQVLNLSGDTRVRNFGLSSRETDLQSSGTSEVEITVTDRLDATVSGRAEVTYRGDPETVNTEVSGEGKIKRE